MKQFPIMRSGHLSDVENAARIKKRRKPQRTYWIRREGKFWSLYEDKSKDTTESVNESRVIGWKSWGTPK